MPTLHLTKVAFGCRTLEALQKRVAARARDGEVRVVTRMRPKRMDELLGGSLHWIVKHRIIARQQILRFDDRSDGRIDIEVDNESMGGDPARGDEKNLTVTYVYQGQRQTVTVREDDDLRIP